MKDTKERRNIQESDAEEKCVNQVPRSVSQKKKKRKEKRREKEVGMKATLIQMSSSIKLPSRSVYGVQAINIEAMISYHLFDRKLTRILSPLNTLEFSSK